MKRIILFFFIITSIHLYSIDLYLHHLDRKTKILKKEGVWNLKESGNFDPRFVLEDENGVPIDSTLIDYSEVSPMIKIVTSDVVFNGSNHSIESKDTFHGGLIGIEIGYSPAELAADSSLKQPSNIQVRNLTLNNFDCGVFIHHGVKEVVIENCTISGTSLGILSLGILGSVLSNSVLDVTVQNVTVVGHASDKHHSLVKLKERVESVYQYPTDHFMKLKADPLNLDTVDVYTYAGLWFVCVENVYLKNIKVHHIGYCDYAQVSEGNGRRSEGIGIILNTCKRIKLKNMSSDDCFSEVKAVGMQLDNILRMRCNDSIFSHHSSALKAVGIEVQNESGSDYSIDEVWFKHVAAEENQGGDIAIGMDLTDSRGFAGYDLIAKFNQGGKEAYGIYTKKAHALVLEDSTLSSNLAIRQTNDVATPLGIVAAGLFGENVAGLQIKRCSSIGMQAMNSVFGVYLKDGMSVRVEDSQFSANVAVTRRSGEEAQVRSEQDIAEISKYGPVVDATNTGGYGFMSLNTSKMKIDRCYAVTNVGHRSAGFCFKNCVSVGLSDSLVSAQVATGTMLDTSFLVDHVVDPTSSSIQLAHKPLLFSDMTKSSIDLVATTDLFLKKMTDIRARQVLGLEPLYDDVVSMLATSNVLQSAVARYRLWGTAFGIHAHNTVGCLLKNNTCVGQMSFFDNAIGIGFTGRNSGHLVDGCNLSYNNAWYLSAQALPSGGTPQYAYKYDLSGMKVFWEALTNPWTQHRSLSNSYDVLSVNFSPDGTMLATGDSNNEIKIWDTTAWTVSETLTGHTASVTSLAWSADGTMLASGSSSTSDNIKIWNTSTWVADQTLTHGSVGVNSVVFKGDGALLASGSGDTSDNIKAWNTSTWVADQTLTHGSVGVNSVVFKGDGTQLASGSGDTSNNIKIWNTSTWVADQTLNSHTDAVKTVTWSPDNSLFASGSCDDSIKIWNTTTWANDQTLTGHTGDVNAVVFKENSKKLVSASSDNSMKVWDTTTWGSAEQTIATHTDVVHALSFKSDGIKVASGSADDTVKIWYADTWKVAPDTDAIGMYNQSIYLIAQGQKIFGDGTLGNDISIRLKGTNDRVFVSPIGPVGAGLILGDFMIDAYVKDNKVHFNIGNAGFGHGILLNQSYYSVLQNNLIEGSVASIYGFGSGILDVTPHCANTYMNNILESNKTSSFGNANYMVPFNPSDSNSLSFPVTKMLNGNFSEPTTSIDNIVIEYSQNSEFYGVESLVNFPLHPDFLSELTDNNCWQ